MLRSKEVVWKARVEVMELKRKPFKVETTHDSKVAKAFKAKEKAHAEVDELRKKLIASEDALKRANIEKELKDFSLQEMEKQLKHKVDQRARLMI